MFEELEIEYTPVIKFTDACQALAQVRPVEVKFVFQGSTWHLIYVAKKDISKNEQLLINYGSSYWDCRDADKVGL